ncbi:MAG: PAS domain-containing protein [Candidatus Alcyoniella australis]|nr:PAS domain-containing protein [Candidatus Alcyoniella australis]
MALHDLLDTLPERVVDALIDSCPDTLLVIDTQGAIVAANEAAELMLGYTRDELCVAYLGLILSGSKLGDNELPPAEPIHDFETQFKTRSGAEVPVLVSSGPIHDEHGFICGGTIIARDVSSQHELQGRLDDIQQMFSSLMDNISLGIYRTTPGPTGRYLYANRSLARMLGYGSAEELKRMPVSELYENPLERKLAVEEVMLNDEVRDKRLRLRRKDGSLLKVLCTSHPCLDDQGHVKWIDGFVQDISERGKVSRD